MQLPDLQAGDILHYTGQEGFDVVDRTLLLISDPVDITLSPDGPLIHTYEFLHNEQILERDIKQLLVLMTCDVIRNGKIIWNRVPDSDKERLKKLRKLCRAE